MTTSTPQLPAPARRRKKIGRPKKLNAARKRRLIRAIAAGVPTKYACAACRVSAASYYAERNRDPQFEEAIEAAIGESIEWHLKNVIRAARAGDVQSSRWYLSSIWPAYFGRTRLELTGEDGGPLDGRVLAIVWPHQIEKRNEKNAVTNPAPETAPDAG